MNHKRFLIVLTLLVSLRLAPAASTEPADPPATVDNFGLFDHEGKFHRLHYFAKDAATRAIVLFVQGNGCPLVRKQIPELTQLQTEYAEKGVLFWMINANLQDDRKDIIAEAKEFNIPMPILIDESQLVAESLKINRTAEAIVIQPNAWKIAYRGPISDRLSYQTEKPQATHQYLREALDAVLQDKPVEHPVVNSPGCRVTLADSDPARHQQISYSQTIAPLLEQRCAYCHTDGGIGPWPMSSYRKIRGWADMIHEVVLTRQMPPWQADPMVGHFSNDFSLSTDEKKTLLHWIDAGAPRGDGPDPLETYQANIKEWSLGPPDHIIDIAEQSVPAEGVIPYRYIIIDSPFQEDTWIRALDINPGNTRVLHHVIATTHILKDGEKHKVKGLAGYAPGMGPNPFPAGTAKLIRAGSKIEFQLHYTSSGKPETDATRLGLYFAKEPPEKELHGGVVIHSKFKIPPAAKEHTVTKTHTFDRDVTLYSMNPHMHYRGKAMRYEALYPDGTTELLLSVPLYHFNWQRNYKLQEPRRLPKGTQLVVTAAWDNSPLNTYNPDPTRQVTWGEQTWDEMFFAAYRYTVDDQKLNVASAPNQNAPSP